MTKTLIKKTNYIKRLIITGMLFSLFSTFALLIGGIIFPIFHLLFTSKNKRQKKFRQLISFTFKILLKLVQYCSLAQINTNDLAQLKKLKGALVISNHPTLIDVVLIISELDSIQCVVKNNLWSNLFIGPVVRGCGYIRNDTDPEHLINSFAENINLGENILIFPEGTRSTPGEKLKFHRGVGHLALHLNADIQIITITCNPPTLLKGDRWYKIPNIKPIINLTAGPNIPTNTFHVDMPRPKRVRHLIRELETFYNGFLKL